MRGARRSAVMPGRTTVVKEEEEDELLAKACKDNNSEVVKNLLLAGANPNAMTEGHHALHWALSRKDDDDLACAEAILEARASVHPSSHFHEQGLDMSPLMYCCMIGNEAGLRLLLDHSLNCAEGEKILDLRMVTQNEIIGNPLTPLMLACLNCHPNCVKVWLEYVKTSGLDLFVQGQSELRNETALSMAVRKALGCTFELFDGKTVTDDDAERARECATAILKKDMFERPEGFTTRYAASQALSRTLSGLTTCFFRHQPAQVPGRFLLYLRGGGADKHGWSPMAAGRARSRVVRPL